MGGLSAEFVKGVLVWDQVFCDWDVILRPGRVILLVNDCYLFFFIIIVLRRRRRRGVRMQINRRPPTSFPIHTPTPPFPLPALNTPRRKNLQPSLLNPNRPLPINAPRHTHPAPPLLRYPTLDDIKARSMTPSGTVVAGNGEAIVVEEAADAVDCVWVVLLLFWWLWGGLFALEGEGVCWGEAEEGEGCLSRFVVHSTNANFY